MPELPEVQTIVTGLGAALEGAVIEHAVIYRPDVVRQGLRGLPGLLIGRRIERLEREGKRIVIRLAPTGTLMIHLGMSGRLTLHSPAAPTAPHTHVRIQFAGRGEELRFRDPRRFGGVWFFPKGDLRGNEGLALLGPDALTIRVPVLRDLSRRKRQIKALLLDQCVISGLGNIYCDEALFGARIHPLLRAFELTDRQVRDLACSVRKTLRAAVAAGGSTLMDYRRADGSEGLFQLRHRVYGREGRSCTRCRSKIERIVVAGRSTFICPRCQRITRQSARGAATQ